MGWHAKLAFPGSRLPPKLNRARTRRACLRPLSLWQLLRDYRFKQPRPYRAVGLWRHVGTLAQQRTIGAVIERRAGCLGGIHPARELTARHSVRVEVHARKALAADHRRASVVDTGMISLQIERAGHAMHAIQH